jgi:hypothetical protein
MLVVQTMLKALVRGRLHIGLVTAGAMFVFVAVLLQELAIGESQRALVAIGLAAHALVTDATAIATAFVLTDTFLIGRGAIPLVARPRSRASFVVSAVIALCIATTISSLALGSALAAVASIYDAPAPLVLLAASVATGEALILGLVAMALRIRFASVFSTATVCAVFLMGRLSGLLAEMLERGTFGILKPILSAFHAIVPNLRLFDWTFLAVGGVGTARAVVPIVYALLYGCALVVLAILMHRRADFAREDR